MKKPVIRCALIGLMMLYSPLLGARSFTVSGRDILLGGESFDVRGICYQPAPIGESGALPPYGDYYTYSARNQELWDRDFANLRKMGANVIRIYGWGLGADHSSFLSQAYNGGDRSLYVLINRYIDPATDWASTAAVDALEAEWVAIANELKDQDAVMGFLIGNEVNAQFGNGTNPDFWDAMNRIAGAVKATAPNKLVAVAITDAMDQVAIQDTYMTNFDFWAMQVYRGGSFHGFIGEYAAASPKPLIITEFGYDALDGRLDVEWPGNAELPADAIEGLLNELRSDDAADDIVSGVCVFEYADEWWKNGDPFSHDFGPRWSGPFADNQFNEEWWGIFRTVDNGSAIDILEPRSLFYRLAAMWNAPYAATLRASLLGGETRIEWVTPHHLKDQRLQVQGSTDLVNWLPVADNSTSQYLSPLVTSVNVTNTLVANEIETTIIHNPAIPPAFGPVNLLANGDFELGSSSGWTTFSGTSPIVRQAGTYSLEFAASGGFSIPLAYQGLDASPGDEFMLSGYMFTAAALPNDATSGLFKIVFKDFLGQDLPPASVSAGQLVTGQFPGAESVPVLSGNSPANTWIFSQTQAVAPAGTVSVEFFAILVDESPAVVNVDSIEALHVNAPPPPAGPTGPKVFFRLVNNGR